ncbi:helix-turn-helix transcriptional regulator [Solirubrobacter soli]|uniref:helix-turn-helix transcriptional regulator n=1 Tax=Solirubrobacter soli TaxID=363832 RepID=UPI0004104248|nr:YafY family protein [Solirubrobacter soli]
MAKTDRVLRLLELLQDRPTATGPELANELQVDTRTLRRDVVALRDLGIPVEGERGRGGSYRIKPGYRVPPLMFTPKEAAAVTLGLMAAKRLGIETDSALTKVRRVLPDRLKAPVESLESTLGFTGRIDAEPPDGETLLALADAARSARKVRVRYTDSQGETSERELTPWGVVAHNGRWYVAAFDHARHDPRTIRADRATHPQPAGKGAPPPPGFDATDFVSRSLASVPWQHGVEVLLHTDHERALQRFPPTLANLEPTPEGTVLRMRADSLDWAAGLLAGAGCDFTIRHPPELRHSVRRLAHRLNAA